MALWCTVILITGLKINVFQSSLLVGREGVAKTVLSLYMLWIILDDRLDQYQTDESFDMPVFAVSID